MTITSWRGTIPVTSSYTAGVGGQIFLEGLKARGVLVGTRCPDCHQVYLPARQFCEQCFAELSEAVTVGPGGSLKSVASSTIDHDNRPLTEIEYWGLVQLDGATTVIVHRLLGVTDLRQVGIGDRVEAVIAPEAQRVGSILDIEGFRLLPK
jgi:uncharacterized OB-fold protein